MYGRRTLEEEGHGVGHCQREMRITAAIKCRGVTWHWANCQLCGSSCMRGAKEMPMGRPASR
jgi:hypothetical protein